MSKPIYEDVKKKEDKCLTCEGDIDRSRTVGNYCSKTCWLARRQVRDRVVKSFRTRSGREVSSYKRS